ncbi:hypothetical protein ACFQ7A_04940 [Streptomyces sp. NPDC056528]|uniref:hypothetical protein n=1 Tax=Streptomyces sp. NPDC056528 TaxID=3345854 RepID=UPI0036BD5E15
MSYQKQMAERARERDAAREEKQSEEPQGPEGATGVPAPGGEVDPLPPEPAAPPARAYRPQPFTVDLIPEPEELEAEGPLTAEEADELAHCEAAYVNADEAEWIKWMAAHAVRSRKTHRGADGTRTWPEYCEEVLGESESEVNRSIKEWPLARAVSQQRERPLATPASHIRALLPVAASYGEEETARSYVALRTWASENKVRVTAADLEAWVQRAQTGIEQPEERPALTAETWLQAREDRVRKQQEKAKPARQARTTPAPQEAAEPDAGEPAVPPQVTPGPETVPEATPTTEGDSALPGTDEEEPQDLEPAGPPAADGSEQDATGTHPLTEQAMRASETLEGMRFGFTDSGILQHADADTLRAIMESALAIAEVAEEALKSR